MKRIALCLLVLSSCATPAPTDPLDLPHERWPMGEISSKSQASNPKQAPSSKLQLRDENLQLRYELYELQLQHECLQRLFRDVSPPF